MAAPRVCSVCRTTRLSRFNTGTVCAPCTRAARDLAQVTPSWLWDSKPMRHALARLDLGAAMAAFRVAAGLSQQNLADMLGWSQSAISLVEKGHRDTLYDLRELLRFADMVEMPRVALAPVLAGEPDASLEDDGLGEPGDGADEDVDRRSFGGLAAGTAAAVMLPEVTIPSQVTAAHVRYLQTCVDSLNCRDQAIGGAVLLKQGLRHWQRARRMLDESDYSERVGGDLLTVTGNLAVCVGWLAFDAANVSLARRLYSEALLLAGSANDPMLSAHVLEKSSMLASFVARSDGTRGRAREALRLADQAADVVRHETMARLHALVALRRANAASVLGDKLAFRSAISRARRELDHGHGGDDPEWIQFVDESEIATQEARGYENLGDPATGAELHRQSLEVPGLSPRNRACGQAQLAAALANSGDLAAAMTEAMHALLALSSGVRSIRTLNYLRPVRAVADKTKAEEFCARFDAVEQAVAT